jgi:hypoxanthine phosphoribosyltransferase
LRRKDRGRVKFISPNWDKVYSQCITLAERLRAKPARALGTAGDNRAFDCIVGVSRGGLALTRILSDHLEVSNVMITRCEYYADIGERLPRPRITQRIPGSKIAGKSLLLVDDVADSGESLSVIKDYLTSKKPNSLTVATLYIKPWTKVYPDYYVAKTDAWIIFPWELLEAMNSVISKGGADALERTGIPETYIRRLRIFSKTITNVAPLERGTNGPRKARRRAPAPSGTRKAARDLRPLPAPTTGDSK